MFIVYMRHCVCYCAKTGAVLRRTWSEGRLTVLLRYVTISTKSAAIKRRRLQN